MLPVVPTANDFARVIVFERDEVRLHLRFLDYWRVAVVFRVQLLELCDLDLLGVKLIVALGGSHESADH